MKLNTCINALLVEGLDDWVSFANVASIAKFTGGESTPEAVYRLAISMIREVLQRELMTIGDVTDAGFIDWPISMEEAIARIDDARARFNDGPGLGYVCWLSNTEKGDALARREPEVG